MSLLSFIFPLAIALTPNADSTDNGGGHRLRNPILNAVYQFVKEFSRVDTAYVEPQRYNYTVMLQNTNTYEIYRLRYSNGRSIDFTPKPSIKVGPYFGWRWIFLGYTIDLARLSDDSHKQDFSLSLYSNQIGLDFFYRKSGEDYTIGKIKLDDDLDTSPLKGATFDGFKSSVKGFNLYYIVNHRKFSYPAAYSQSTIQRRSCGSPMFGIGYTHHKLDIDWDKFRSLVTEKMGEEVTNQYVDSTLTVGQVNYYDYTVTAGYSYNWVFAHNWLANVSFSLGLGYKHSKNEVNNTFNQILKDFDIKNFNLDGVTRLGLVYNNMRWYAGASAVFHSYNYHKEQFSTNNFFGYVNLYVGFNFGKR